MPVLARIPAQRGQATVELIAALPVLALVMLCAWQVVLTGHSLWTVAEAARVGAREYAVQRRTLEPAAARARARRAIDRVLPVTMRAGSSAKFSSAGAVVLRARMPLAGPFAALFRRGPSVTSRAGFS